MTKADGFDDWIAKVGQPVLKFPHLPDRDLPTPRLLDIMEEAQGYREEAAKARRIIPIGIAVPGPVGIHVFGDPHIDDPDCDIRQLRADVALVRRTEGMYALCIGDDRNNWVGRLGSLYANQNVSAANARRLVEWFVRSLTGRWIVHIGGNHDLWSGADDPLDWLARQAGSAYEPWEARLELSFPEGQPLLVTAKHKWAGKSIYNPVHGITRGVLFGERCHVAIGGHEHVSGRGTIRDEISGIITEAVQVASYKGRDDFARKIGARDNHVSCSATIIIDPESTEANARVLVMHNAEKAARYLRWERSEWKRRRK